jgi:predicted lipopolysaccharide heptosyltransferase III
MHILLIRLRLIGDVVFTTPAVRALRRHFPASRLAYLVEEAAAPVVAGNPHVDEVLVLSRERGFERLAADVRMLQELRRHRFDVAIDFHGGPRAAWLTWTSGARRRIGYSIPGRSWMYTDVVKRARELRPRHSVENQWDLLAPLGIPSPDAALDATEMTEDPAARARVDARLAACGIAETDELVVIHVSAGNPFRRWPAEAFAKLAASLAAGRSRRIVLTSGPSDHEAASAIGRQARTLIGAADASRIVATEDFDLAELRALVGRAALFVGGDSGPLHIAGTTATPIVGLYGPTLPVRSQPWRDPAIASEAIDVPGLECRPCDQRVCVPGDFRCLTRIAPEAVVAAAERLLTRPTHAAGVAEPVGTK